MKRKIAIISAVVLAVVALATWAIPSFAAGTSIPSQATSQNPQVNKARVLVRLLMVQDGTKVDAFLSKVHGAGKLTGTQAAEIKTVWTNNHAAFAPGKPLLKLLAMRSATNLDIVLQKGVAAGKLQPVQANKIEALWHQLRGK